jgi:hypothetical protein
MLKTIALAAGALTAAAAVTVTLPAAEAQPTGPSASCFRMGEIMNTRMHGYRTLYLRASSGAFYRMDFGADCNNLGTEPLVLHPFDNGDEICRAVDLDVRVRGTGEACIPISLKRLSPAEVAALLPVDKP